MNKLTITPKITIPIEISSEGVKEAIEDYIRVYQQTAGEIVFPKEYDVRLDGLQPGPYPAISIILESTEPEKKKPGPKPGSKRRPKEVDPASGLSTTAIREILGRPQQPLTKADANHILVAMGASWDDLPAMTDVFLDTLEAQLDKVSEAIGKNWRDFDDRK